MTSADSIPSVRALLDAPVRAIDGDGRVRIARLVTSPGADGTSLLTGGCWVDPGGVLEWDQPEHLAETYYLVRGAVTLSWPDGEARLSADDAFAFTPALRYRIANEASEPAFLVYAMTPAPAG